MQIGPSVMTWPYFQKWQYYVGQRKVQRVSFSHTEKKQCLLQRRREVEFCNTLIKGSRNRISFIQLRAFLLAIVLTHFNHSLVVFPRFGALLQIGIFIFMGNVVMSFQNTNWSIPMRFEF